MLYRACTGFELTTLMVVYTGAEVVVQQPYDHEDDGPDVLLYRVHYTSVHKVR